ncbi:MAG: ferric iron uptake transcriptional regulator [Gammaproteobacteria bacterium]|nr:ferric iron uptake transcriptional regulator [Gammaproteobacteria bacterium]
MSQRDIRKAGLRVTLPRLRVLQVLEEAEPHHLSAEDIYKKLLSLDESIGHATVYRVLMQFEDAQIVRRHNFADDGHAVYELAEGEHHDHMVDIDTGEVIEFVNENIETLQQKIADDHGVDLVDHELVLYVKKRTQ